MTEIDNLGIKDKRNVLRIFVRTIVFLILLLVVFVIVFMTNQRHGELFRLDKSGALDLSDYNFEERGRVYLQHGWDFYPNQLLRPSDFSEHDETVYPSYTNFSISPAGWASSNLKPSSNLMDSRYIGDNGVGTYRLRMKVPKGTDLLSMDFPEINYAAEIYVNGTLVKEIGKATDNPADYRHQETYSRVNLQPDELGNIDIVVSCANFTSAIGGITVAPALGTPDQVESISTISKMWICVVITLSLLIIIAGFFVAATFRNKQKYFYFTLIIICSLLYEISDKFIVALPGSWNKLLQVTFYFLLMFITSLYFASIYPREFDFFGRIRNWDIIIIFVAMISFLSAYWIAPHLLYRTSTLVANSLFAAGINFYNFFRVLYKTPRHPKEGTFHLISSVLASIIFSTLLIRSPQVYFISLHSIGVVVLVFGTAMYFTIRYVRNFEKISMFTQELEVAVQEKTGSITKVNAELVNANQMLIKNEEARKKMMSNVSHDLRTPITAIRGYIELIMNSKNKISQENLETYLRSMHTRSVQMEQLIDDLVQLTRLESDNAKLDKQPISLKDMIESLFELYVMETEGSGKQLTLDLPDNDSLTIMGDPNRMLRVIENIIVNALRYTEEDGIVEVSAYRESALLGGESIHFTVRDNGIGIPTAEQLYIFDRFYRAANAAVNKSGSGLGLSIVKSIVDKHNGKIWVESVEKKGTRFHVIIPAANRNNNNKSSAEESNE
ncbi:MAG TPA: hypothetical protein GXZ67_09740 [Clostridiaceae bacterium]|nr:hypothetical protein [Clostridiaceae bacterium]